jgi:hypothetical protein
MTPDDPETLKVAFDFIDTLQRLGVRYHLGGSYASAIHGVPRQTHDVDLVVDLHPEQVHALVRLLSGEFYVDEEAVARAVAEHATCNLVHFATGLKIDLFIKGTSPFDEQEFGRCVQVRLGTNPPRDVCVKSAEDILLRKLLWFRLGGEVSDRQWEDVRGVVRIQQGKLDLEYLGLWAERLSIRDLLERAVQDH